MTQIMPTSLAKFTECRGQGWLSLVPAVPAMSVFLDTVVQIFAAGVARRARA